MERTTVSVIVPVYNSAKYLANCLDSLLNQTLENIEIICVNDGSTDNSAKIIEQYAGRYPNIKYIYQNNSGPGLARKNGIHHACGDYIGFLDSDDSVSENYYNDLYKTAQQYSEADIIYKDLKDTIQDTNGLLETAEQKCKIIEPANLWSKLFKKDFIQCNGMFWHRANFVEDIYTWIPLLISAKKIAVVKSQSTYNYTEADSSHLSCNISYSKVLDAVDIFTSISNYPQNSNLASEDVKVYSFTINNFLQKYAARIFYHLPYPDRRKYVLTIKKKQPAIKKTLPHLNLFWKIVKTENKKELYICGTKIFTVKRKRLYSQTAKNTAEARQ